VRLLRLPQIGASLHSSQPGDTSGVSALVAVVVIVGLSIDARLAGALLVAWLTSWDWKLRRSRP
jgi:hypothetical protein